MKKLRAILVFALLAAVLCVGVFAAEKTVYISSSGNDSADGSAYTAAVKSFERAYALIGNDDGKIVVCNYMNLGSAYVLPAHSGNVTITASDGKNYFPLGKLAISGTFSISGDTVFDRIGITASGATAVIANGNDLTMGKNVKTNGSIVIFGGKTVSPTMTAEEASINNDYTITIKGGEFTYLRGGNRRTDGKSPFGTISGNCTINIAGGVFTSSSASTNAVTAAGMNFQTGNVTLNISGGEISGNVFAVGRAGTNETSQTPTVSGNVTINVTGGTIHGTRLDENQDGSVVFNGKYTLNLTDGKFSNIESIKGGDAALLTLSETLKNGGVKLTEFTNPLRGGADPWVTYRDGYYYMTIVSGVTVYCYKSSTLDGIGHVPGVAIWSAPTKGEINSSNKHYSQEIWSPELHYIDESEFGAEYAGWWLYFAADDGDNTNHRLFAVRALTADALGKYGSPVTGEEGIPVKMVVDNDKTWAIGQSLLRVNGVTYLTWTSEDGRGTADHKQDIRIAKLDNPYTVGESSVICYAEYDWESKGYAYNANTGASYPRVVEGATAVYGDNGEIMIIYSASGYWTNYYCLSTLTLKDGADPLKKTSWIKASEPVFTHQNGVFGPGHAAYVTDAEGNRFMMYHAYLNWKRDVRYVFIQPWTLNGTAVDMNGGPYSQDTVLNIYNNYCPLTDVISGFAK